MMTMTQTLTTDAMMLRHSGHSLAVSSPASSQASRQRNGGGRTRVTMRGKVVLIVLTTLVSWLGWSTFSAEPAYSEPVETQVVNYTIQPGDNLWSYAEGITPAGGDVSQRVDEIMQLNHLDSPVLHPGQIIVVPAH